MENKKQVQIEQELTLLINQFLENKNKQAAIKCKKLVKKSAKAVAKKFEKKLEAIAPAMKKISVKKVAVKKVAAAKKMAAKKVVKKTARKK